VRITKRMVAPDLNAAEAATPGTLIALNTQWGQSRTRRGLHVLIWFEVFDRDKLPIDM